MKNLIILFPIIMGFLLATLRIEGEAIDLDALTRTDGIRPRGEMQSVEWPDTLDLAERADLLLNYVLKNHEPDHFYSLYHIFRFDLNPPEPSQLTWNLPVKELRLLPWLRCMTGDEEDLDVESAIMRTYLQQIDEDDIMRYPYGGEGFPVGTTGPYAHAMLGMAIVNWHARDGDPIWLTLLGQLGKGIDEMAIRVEQRAYFPTESGYKTKGEWVWNTRKAATSQFIPYTPPAEPDIEQQGFEGVVKYKQSAPLRTLVHDYRLNKNEEAIDLARKLVRFMMKPGMWANTKDKGYLGSEKGIWEGHFHANVTAMHGLIEYALAVGDERIKQVVKTAYEHARRNTAMRMGWNPFWIPPGGYNRPEWLSGWCETCSVGDMIVLAVKLNDAGLGDYWNDVDYLVRNQLVESQITDLDLMREVTGGGAANDAILKKFLGGFSAAEPTVTKPLIYGCCSINAGMGLYYAWHGITRFNQDVAEVNLFLNRVSPWMDVESHLPYEGKVVLTNKKARTALVRIPEWVDRATLKSFMNEMETNAPIVSNRLVYTDLEEDDRIRIEFAVPEYTERYEIYGTNYTVKFRGGTLLMIEPRDVKSISQEIEKFERMIPVYQRDEFKKKFAPRHTVKRFVAERIMPIQ